MRTFIAVATLSMFALLSLAIASQWPVLAPIVAIAVTYVVLAAIVVPILFLLAGLVFLIIWIVMWRRRKQVELCTAHDGVFPLQPFAIEVDGQRVQGHINPNNVIGIGVVVSSQGVQEIYTTAVEHHLERTRQLAPVMVTQAAFPGNETYLRQKYLPVRPPSFGGMGQAMRGMATPKQLAAPATAPDLGDSITVPSAPAVQPLTALAALQESAGGNVVLGQRRDGGMCVWEPQRHLNLGVFGNSGTGKTKSIGFAVIASACQWAQVVVIDPKGGADFEQFAPYTEWAAVDAKTFGDCVAALYEENVRRAHLLAHHKFSEWHKFGGREGPGIVVVMEEFGTMRDEVAMLKGGGRSLDAIDEQFQTMLRTCRASGFHIVLIDQRPEKLDSFVRGSMTLRPTFQLDIAPANVLQEYEAPQLPPNGAFMVRRQEYAAWNYEHVMPQVLPTMPRFGHLRLLGPAHAATELPNRTTELPNCRTEPPAPEVANYRTATEPNELRGANAPVPPTPATEPKRRMVAGRVRPALCRPSTCGTRPSAT